MVFLGLNSTFEPMKTRIFFILIATLALTQSCKKEGTTPAADEAPFSRIFFVDNWFKQTSIGSGTYEYGCVFEVTKNGSVTKLGCKMPDTSTYRVVLWDSAAQSVMAEKTMDAKSNELHMEAITPVALSTGKKYVLSIRSVNKRWFYFVNYAGGKLNYPFIRGNIKVTGYLWTGTTSTAAPKFPTNIDQTYVAGMADLEFQANKEESKSIFKK